jgi:hypothetical protein
MCSCSALRLARVFRLADHRLREEICLLHHHADSPTNPARKRPQLPIPAQLFRQQLQHVFWSAPSSGAAQLLRIS